MRLDEWEVLKQLEAKGEDISIKPRIVYASSGLEIWLGDELKYRNSAHVGRDIDWEAVLKEIDDDHVA